MSDEQNHTSRPTGTEEHIRKHCCIYYNIR